MNHALWPYLILFCSSYVRARSRPTIWTKCSVLLTDFVLVTLFHKMYITLLKLLWVVDNWFLSHHCCSILKTSQRSLETVCWNFPLMRIARTPSVKHPFWSSPSVTSFTTRQNTSGNKMPLCGQTTYHSRVSPVSVAAIFLPPRMEPIHC